MRALIFFLKGILYRSFIPKILQVPIIRSSTKTRSHNLRRQLSRNTYRATLVSADLPLTVSRRPLDGLFARPNNGEPQWRYGVSSGLQPASDIERCVWSCVLRSSMSRIFHVDIGEGH